MEELQQHGIEPCLVTPPQTPTSEPSATCVCMVTPDGQRTMRTCLGAATFLTAATLPLAPLERCNLLHCEGYALYKPDMLRAAVGAAKAAGAQVSLDLASFEVIANCCDMLMEVLATGLIDIVFCNEDEAAELDKLAHSVRSAVISACDCATFADLQDAVPSYVAIQRGRPVAGMRLA